MHSTDPANVVGGEKTLKDVIDAGGSSSSSVGAAGCSGNLKRKQGSEDCKKGPEVKKVRGLWQDELDDLDDEDLSDSSEEEDEDKVKKILCITGAADAVKWYAIFVCAKWYRDCSDRVFAF